MNINIGDSGYIIRYIQAFLQENYSQSLTITGKYDRRTHEALIEYLDLPMTKKSSEVLSILLEEFPDISYYFSINRRVDEISFTSKSKSSEETVKFMLNMQDRLRDVLYSCGWKISEYNPYLGNIESYNSFTVTTSGVNNIFPRDQVQCMVNRFSGEYVYDAEITYVGGNYGDVRSNAYGWKIAKIKCNPNTTYTIVHGGSQNCKIVMGSSPDASGEIYVNRITDRVEVNLNQQYPVEYTTSKNAEYLLIQVPSNTYKGEIIEPTEEYTPMNIVNLLVLKNLDGYKFRNSYPSKDGDPELKDNEIVISMDISSSPWCINDKFISYISNISITPDSDKSRIKYLQNMLLNTVGDQYFLNYWGKYDDGLRNAIMKLQKKYGHNFPLGYCDPQIEGVLVTIAESMGVNLYE